MSEAESNPAAAKAAPADEVDRTEEHKLKEQISMMESEVAAAESREAAAEAAEDEIFTAFENDMKATIESKVAAARNSEVLLEDMKQRLLTGYDSHRTDAIKSVQTDILRTNKVIRDVSRALASADWRPVFNYLMAAQFSKAEIEEHAARIQKQNMPMTQAYKALLLWRDTKPEDLSLTQLADGLRLTGHSDLADYVLDTLECEGEDLFKLNLTPKQSSTMNGAAAAASKPSNAKADSTDAAAGDGEAKEKRKPPLQKTTSTIGVLDDRKFLQLAKLIGGNWQGVAVTLGIDEEDSKEILEAEGATYQGAFKMLWTWRDRTIENDQDHANILREALKTAGKEDAAQIV